VEFCVIIINKQQQEIKMPMTKKGKKKRYGAGRKPKR